MTATDTHLAIEAVFRIEQAKLIAVLARMVRDVGIAEDLAQEALIVALERWPESGIPDNPGAWLMATAKRRAIDIFRRNKLLERKHEELSRELEVQQEMNSPDLDTAIDDDISDDLLRLIFTACHPVLSSEARAALTLRLLGGLTTEEIARAFLIPEATVAQRIVRAKPSARPGCRPCSRSSTSFSMRATRRPLVITGCDLNFARRRSASVGSWPHSLPKSRKSTAWSLSWSSRPRASVRASTRRENLFCCSIRTGRDGISSLFAVA